MHPLPCFSTETIDGCRLGCLHVPTAQMADWLNFLITPQYQVSLLSVEQTEDTLSLYFDASEGVYLYLDMRLNRPREVRSPAAALAS